MADRRPEPPHTGSELEVLNGFLDYQRGTVDMKVAGLDDEQSRRPLVGSSPLTTPGPPTTSHGVKARTCPCAGSWRT